MAKLRQLYTALKALQKSVERTLLQDFTEGAGEPSVRSYQNLHSRVTELLPDDFYIADGLALATKPDDSDRKMLGAVQFTVNQLISYLEGQVRGINRPSGSGGGGSWSFEAPQPPHPPSPPDFGDLKNLGRDLQEQIVNMTRSTIKRALSNIDIDFDGTAIYGTDLRGQDLDNQDFKNARLQGTNLKGASAKNADFENASLIGINASGVNFTGADFSGARIEGSNFTGVTLEDANLEGAVFQGANLSGAYLSGANLTNARFVGTNLTGAVLPNDEVYQKGDDLSQFGVKVGGKHHIHIEIDTNDEKPKNGDEKYKNDEEA